MRRLLLAAGVGLVAVHVAVLAYHLTLTVAFPFDLDYGEGYVLNDAVRLARGEAIYVDLQQFPMVRSPYPPLYPLVWSWLVPLTGPSFWPGRLLSSLALLGLGGLAAWNAWRVGAGRWPLLLAPGLIAASPFVYQWAGYARVDLLALLLAAGGVLTAQWVRGWRGVLGAAMLCGLAMWTKQTTATAAIAVALALFARGWRPAVLFVLTVAAPSAVAVLALDRATGGEFSQHVLLGNASNPFSAPRSLVYVTIFGALHLPVLAGSLWWVRKTLRGVPSPVALYVPVSLLVAFSAGNEGSSVNYLLEPIVACALAFPFVWRALPSPATLGAPVLACVQLAVLLHWPNAFGTDYLRVAPHGRTPTADDYAIGQAVDAAVRAEPGAVIAEPAGFSLRNDRPVYLQPIDLRAEQLKGRWQSGPLIEALSAGQFRLLVTAYNLLPADVERAVGRQFVRIDELAGADGLTFGLYRYAPCSGC